MGKRMRLKHMTERMDESIGQRSAGNVAVLTPLAQPQDKGRQSAKNFGRLSIEQLMPDPNQPRVTFDKEEISQLARSLQQTGQIHPIRIRWSADHGKWLIISGERRYRAALQAGLAMVDCDFRDKELSESKILEQQLIENLLRSDLKPLEEAQAFRQLIEMNVWTGVELAKTLHISRARVTRSLALLRLPLEIQELVATGKLAPSVAYELSKLKTEQHQWAVIAQQKNGQLTTAKVTRQIRKRSGTKRRRGTQQTFLTESGWKVLTTHPSQSNYHELEAALSEALDEVRLRIDNNVVLIATK